MIKITMFFCILISFNFAFAQQTNSSGLTIVAQQSVDGKQYKTLNGRHVPYASAAEFLAYVTATRRHIGEIGYIYNGTAIEVWQFVLGIADVNFVKVISSGGGGSTTRLDSAYTSFIASGSNAIFKRINGFADTLSFSDPIVAPYTLFGRKSGTGTPS